MLELYANWGRGFHSNDVRGAVNVDTPVPLLVRGTGKELGGRVQIGSASLIATYWWLNVGSELRFVGDRSEEHTSELQSLMRISYAVFCLKKKRHIYTSNASYFV